MIGTMADAFPEAWWSVERIGGGKVFISGQVRCGITLLYVCPGPGVGVGGGDERGGWRK